MLLLLALGCVAEAPKTTDPTDAAADDTGSGDTDTGGDTDTDTDTDSGGADEVCAAKDITIEGTAIATVLRVRWTTEVPTTGHVEFGADEAFDLVTPATEIGTEHEMLLLGVTADTDVAARVVTAGEGCTSTADPVLARTGSLPSGLFPTRATGSAPWTGYQVLPLQGTGYALVIIDREGHYVWYHQVENAGNLMRAFLSADGKHVVLCHAGPQEALENGKIVWVPLDGSEVTEVPFPYIDHDMVELPDGTIAAIVVDTQDGDQADKIVELRPDGTTVDIFSAWDNWSREELDVEEFQHNWTHANGLDYDPVEDVYYLSMKSLESLAKIDRATGEVLWTMNGKLNEFTSVVGDGVAMHHQFHVLDGSILFFENGPPDRAASRAVEVEVDVEAREIREVWSYTSDPPLYVFAKGDVHRFEDGITQVVWSSAGQIQNVTPEGEVVWQLDLELGQAMTFVQYVPSMYASQW